MNSGVPSPGGGEDGKVPAGENNKPGSDSSIESLVKSITDPIVAGEIKGVVDEVIEYFDLPKAPLQHLVERNEKKVFADLTLGAAGHAAEIVKRGGFVVGIEADPKMVKIARKTLEGTCRTYSACPADNFPVSTNSWIEGESFNRRSELATVLRSKPTLLAISA